jgi:hypothetical protein
MDKKLVITALYNEKKPIKYEQLLSKEKDGGMYMNYTESIITQIVKARNEDHFKAVCERIQDFIKKEGIDVCFAINQNELLDCLNEHQRLKLQIQELERRLSNCIEPKFKVGQEVWLVLYDGVKKDVIENNYHLYSLEKSRLGLYESCLYATEEEAKAKLEKLKNG